jgi:hypothetical protein
VSTPIKQSTNNYMVPASGGTHAVAFTDLLSGTPTLYDFRQFTLDNFPFVPQGAYVDNTANDSPVTFTFDPIGLNISVPAQSFAAFNFPAPKGLTVNATGGGNVTTVWVDYPVLPQVYYGNSASQPVNVPAAPLAGAYLNRVIPSAVFEAKNARITGAGTSAVVTPANAANLRKLLLDISADSAMAAAGENTVTVTVNGVAVAVFHVVLPAAAGTSAQWSKTIDFDNVAPNSAGAAVTVSVSTAFSAGGLDVNAFYDA